VKGRKENIENIISKSFNKSDKDQFKTFQNLITLSKNTQVKDFTEDDYSDDDDNDDDDDDS
jgi:hypothetical protein